MTADTIAGLAHLASLRRLDTAYMMAPQEAPAPLDEFAALTGALPCLIAHRDATPSRLGQFGRRYRAGFRRGVVSCACSGSPVTGLQNPNLPHVDNIWTRSDCATVLLCAELADACGGRPGAAVHVVRAYGRALPAMCVVSAPAAAA